MSKMTNEGISSYLNFLWCAVIFAMPFAIAVSSCGLEVKPLGINCLMFLGTLNVE